MNANLKESGFDSIQGFRKIEQVRKRDGTLVPYDFHKIETAICKAMYSAVEAPDPDNDSTFVARNVQSQFQRAATLMKAVSVPEVEAIQDAIERELMLQGFTATAKHFILYRDERARLRAVETEISPEVRSLVESSRKYFRNPLAEFVYYRTYSRWIEQKSRRETWIETVERYMAFMRSEIGGTLSDNEYDEIFQAILRMEVMPSMRLMWSAGVAAEKTNVSAFNCAFIAPTCFQDFAEILYVLACGTGVGFSVESRSVQQLPMVEFQKLERILLYKIEDSKEGWATALSIGMRTWYGGDDVHFDYSLLRPEGARLRTMGGRSSGPKPLMDLLQFVRSKILNREGRRLTNLDVHDIICKIGDCIVAGGVRRSALISLSDLDDTDMKLAKQGHFFISNNQRQLANNSAVYLSKPSAGEFLREWMALVESRSGERGIFNRGGLFDQIPQRRRANWLQYAHANNAAVLSQIGTNPCGEINLLSKQFCNLTEVVCRADDDFASLLRKARIATILGTYQSMLTNYPYLSEEWKENCERERLLGVSLTGQWDCEVVRNSSVLEGLREAIVETNIEFAKKFGINPSTAVTCVKPSGTVSQLVDAAPGMHPRYAPYYIRRVRISSSDPLFRMLKDQGLPFFPDVGQTFDSASTFVFEFPVKSPEDHDKVYNGTLNALDQLEYWKKVKKYYTEHNPSVTISVGENEWVDVGHWVWQNWEIVGGLSFLPREDHVYQLAPYEAIDEARYTEMCKKFEGVDYSRIVTYEKEDNTEGSKEFACVSGACEI
jgi:ribonucleoside-diphosphate reductase alpha chain